jgi:hypothetical protein
MLNNILFIKSKIIKYKNKKNETFITCSCNLEVQYYKCHFRHIFSKLVLFTKNPWQRVGFKKIACPVFASHLVSIILMIHSSCEVEKWSGLVLCMLIWTSTKQRQRNGSPIKWRTYVNYVTNPALVKRKYSNSFTRFRKFMSK